MQRSWESFSFKAGSVIDGINCSAHKNDKVSVNVSHLVRATAGVSVLAEGGELYNQAVLNSHKHDNMHFSILWFLKMCSCYTGTPLSLSQLYIPTRSPSTFAR